MCIMYISYLFSNVCCISRNSNCFSYKFNDLNKMTVNTKLSILYMKVIITEVHVSILFSIYIYCDFYKASILRK
jgi:hypothetical protein